MNPFDLITFPLIAMMKFLLEISYSMTNNYGWSIILMSLFVNLIILPLYYYADYLRNKDKKIQEKMAPEIAKIKRSYKGRERHFYIKTIHRRFQYTPLSSVKASLGFLIQIPFFFAAYTFLASYEPLKGISFLYITNLSQPDMLLYGANALPIAMTVINLLSALVYANTLNDSEKKQIWGLALLFLVLLYNEPSGLLLYWTMNNVFSFFKNLVQKVFFEKDLKGLSDSILGMQKDIWKICSSIPKDLIVSSPILLSGLYFFGQFLSEKKDHNYESAYYSVAIFAILAGKDYFAYTRESNKGKKIIWWVRIGFLYTLYSGIQFFLTNFGDKKKTIFLENTVYGICILSIILISFKYLRKVKLLNEFQVSYKVFVLPLVSYLLLFVFLNPLNLLNASKDFSINLYEFLQRSSSTSLLFFTAISLVFALVTDNVKKIFYIGINLILILGLIYSQVIIKDYGLLDQMIFNTPDLLKATANDILSDLLVFVICILTITYLVKNSWKSLLKFNQGLLIVILCIITINFPFKSLFEKRETKIDQNLERLFSTEQQKTLSFSKKKNVFILWLDAAPGDIIQRIKDENATFINDFDGFTWYKDTLSTGTGTWLSLPSIIGGHSKRIDVINKSNTDKDYQQHVDESYKVFPNAFPKDSWQFSYFNPQYSTQLPEHVYVSKFPFGKYYFGDTNNLDPKTEFRLLLTISGFNFVPLSLKEKYYGNGTWSGVYSLASRFINDIEHKAPSWGLLNLLTTSINSNSEKNTFKFFQIETPHGPHVYSMEDKMDPKNSNYHIEQYKTMEKVALLIKKLKSIGVYDNSKIVIVSDHGWWDDNLLFDNKKFNAITKSSSEERVNPSMVHPLLMVKEFQSTGPLKESDIYMSNADIAAIICSTEQAQCDIEDLDPRETDVRKRSRHVINGSFKSFKQSKHIEIKDHYEVKGSIFEIENWNKVNTR